VQYIGTYPIGSAGNDDAQFMSAMARAGLVAFAPAGVIHDLSQLTYEWGDRLEMLFSIGLDAPTKGTELVEYLFGKQPKAEQPAVVIGASCEEAVRTLLLGEDSTAPIDEISWVFRELESAWFFIENQLAPA
jgi:hypothetical protein